MLTPHGNADCLERRTQLSKLRNAYDIAFRNLVAETRHRQAVAGDPLLSQTTLSDVALRVERASVIVRYRRDMLAEFLISGSRGRRCCAPRRTIHAGSKNRDLHSRHAGAETVAR
jgi:hypothetical protein